MTLLRTASSLKRIGVRWAPQNACSPYLSLYGSILLYEDAGGYVLVGVIAFTAAVIITVFCIRYRKQRGKTNEKEVETL